MQTVINVLTAAHAIYTDAALLCKTDILDIFRLRPLKVLFRCKAPIQGNLEGIAAINLIVTVKHLFHEGSVRRIAFDDKTVRDQIGRPYTEANFMPIESIPAIFLDDVRVGLEERNNLVLSRNALTVKDPTGGFEEILIESFSKRSISATGNGEHSALGHLDMVCEVDLEGL